MYCDNILRQMFKDETQDLDYIIQECFDDDEWIPKNNENKNRFWSRLNYKLTDRLSSSILIEEYVVEKYTLYPDLLDND